MAAAGAILVKTMNLLAGKIRPGVTTADLDEAAEKFIRSQGATPAFKGYRGFPGSICASPNEMIVHGIPGPYALARGDILSVDIGVVYDGWVADAARTFGVGPISPVATKLLQVTEESLFLAVEQCRVGNRLGDVSHADPAARRGRRPVDRPHAGRPRGRARDARGAADPQLRHAGHRHPARGGDGHGRRADGHRRPARGAGRRRPLGDLLPGRVARRPFRVHDRGHRGGARGCSRPGTRPETAARPHRDGGLGGTTNLGQPKNSAPANIARCALRRDCVRVAGAPQAR